MKQLIVNADDFGRHKLINRAVFEGFSRGILRSATVMPMGAAFEDAIKVARRCPELGVGVHLTLVGGHPVASPREIPSLVTENGALLANYGEFLKRYLRCGVRLGDVRKEVLAQIRKVQKAGVAVTHLDSHQHVYMLPGVFSVVLDVAKEEGIRAVRIPEAPVFMDTKSVGQMVGKIGLNGLAKVGRRTVGRRDFRSPDYFRGIVAGGAVDEECLMGIIRGMEEGVTEVMMHPGTDNLVLGRECGWEHDFRGELDALTSLRVLETLKKEGVELVNFEFL